MSTMAESRAHDNGKEGLSAVKQVLTDVGWKPENTGVEGVLRVDFSVDKTPIADAVADIRIEYERFLFYLNFRDKAPKKYREQTMEFITLVNFDLVIGNFEMNLDNGLVRFKSSIDFTHAKLVKALVRSSIRSAMDVVEQYADALVEVMHGSKDVRAAIEEAESGDLEDDEEESL
jgi:hypothetical protein